MHPTRRELKFTEPNRFEAPTGWVRSHYVNNGAGRWVWSHRSIVFSEPFHAIIQEHRYNLSHLTLVRQFPHRLNDVVEIPIWPDLPSNLER